MNPAIWLDRAGTRWPDRPALFRGAEAVASYGAFRTRAAALALGLQRAGIGPGDRLVLFAANRTEYLVAMQAVWWAGAVVVPVNHKLHPRELAWIVADSGARMVLSDAAAAQALGDRCGAARVIDMDSPGFAALFADGPAPPLHATAPDDLVWLFYTSGTTGRPKGVMLTPGNLQAMILSFHADVATPRAGDAKLYAAPMSHGAGLYQFPYMIAGARHVVPASGGFDGAEVLELAARPGNLVFFAAPTMVRRLVAAARAARHDGSGIARVIYGGGPMYLADLREAIDTLGHRLAQIYGQGETPMTITVLTRDAHRHLSERGDAQALARLASVGVAQAACEVTVLDGEGRPVAPGTVGEVAVRGPSVMKGYWNNETATRDTIRNGWLMTGDLGALDDGGYLTLHDRSRDVIVSGGSNIYPREVEEALLTHPDVAEVSVIGLPDPEWGETVLAFVVLHDAAADHAAAAAALDAHCLHLIARFKRPKTYRFLPALPKNAYGKIPKTSLRELAQASP